MISAENLLFAVLGFLAVIIGLCMRWGYLAGKWHCYHCDRVNKPWAVECHWCGFEYREPTWR